MKLTERKKMILINIVCVLALAVILWPLLVISKYNYPSADDWSYGVNTYRAIQNHEGVFNSLRRFMKPSGTIPGKPDLQTLHWHRCNPESLENIATPFSPI